MNALPWQVQVFWSTREWAEAITRPRAPACGRLVTTFVDEAKAIVRIEEVSKHYGD